MTEIDFYILESSPAGAQALFSCKLTEKVYRQGHHVYINCMSGTQVEQLDDMLWTFRAGSFVPHGVHDGSAADLHPVMLGSGSDPAGCHDVLINLASDVPSWFSRFDRVAELVCGDGSQRTAAREHYRFYQDRGYNLRTHNLKA